MANKFHKFLALAAFVTLLGGSVLVYAEETVDDSLPSDVEAVQAFPDDGQIVITWDPATDDTGVEGYYLYSGLSSVTDNGGSYTFGSTNVGDVTTYTMENLSNGVTYYFALTAYDAAGNESEYYSDEVEGTPEESETGDFTEPTVSDASALSSTLIEVEFSEEITLPEDGSTAFSVESSEGAALEVLDAYVSDDASVVFVVTDTQTAGAQYILTAGIEIADYAGNPIVSGTSDTAIFTGSSLEDVETEEIAEEVISSSDFKLENVDAVEANELTLFFSSEIASADPDAFTIAMADDASQEVAVLLVSIDTDDATQVTLVSEEMESGYDYIVSVDDTVVDVDGNSLSEDAMELAFEAKTLDVADLIPPEDITDFVNSILNETSVMLSWTASVDSAGDLTKYLLYQSSDGGSSYGSSDDLGLVTETTVDSLTPGGTYTFKVTAMDENGNESEGEVTVVTLPEAGPGMLAMGALSLFGASAWTRRRRDY